MLSWEAYTAKPNKWQMNPPSVVICGKSFFWGSNACDIVVACFIPVANAWFHHESAKTVAWKEPKEPVGARKTSPMAICGMESEGAMRTDARQAPQMWSAF